MGNDVDLKKSAEAFTPRTGDVYIVAYPRSGTTWLQMILYQILTRGDMNFTHISQFVPFLERVSAHGGSLPALLAKRTFKTHRPLSKVKRRGGKYIYLARNGKDVLASCYYFHKDYLKFEGPFEEFFEKFLSGNVRFGSWFRHIADSRLHAGDKSVLFIEYEDLVSNFEARLDSIVSFLELTMSPAKRAQVLERCSFQFMRQHESKFDYATEVLWEKMHDPRSGKFIRKGGHGGWSDYLSAEQAMAFESAVLRLRQLEGVKVTT